MVLFEGAQLVLVDSREHRWMPRWLCAEPPSLERMRPVQRYASFLECVRQRKARKVCLHRTYALGDILMLIPVARAVHRLLGLDLPFLIPVEGRFLNHLRGIRDETILIIESRGIIDYGCDVHIDLDSCLEVDHRDPVAAAKDRLTLYAETLGCRLRT